jgi:hypothetical protein
LWYVQGDLGNVLEINLRVYTVRLQQQSEKLENNPMCQRSSFYGTGDLTLYIPLKTPKTKWYNERPNKMRMKRMRITKLDQP